jgi:4-amino-4-deoxy-L-arabinose transferase
MKITNNPKKQFLILAVLVMLLAAFTILYHLGTTGIFETSEGRYASVARAMLDTGNWLTPVHNGIKHLTKPPVAYWAGASGMKLFGINEFGARFFLAVAAGLTALGCFLIGKTLFNTTTGLTASIILTCSVFFQIQFRGYTTDPYLTMFETFMVFAFIRFFQTFNHKGNKKWELFFWLMASMAMLTKGPPGLLPLTGLIPALLLSGKKQILKKLFSSLPGWITFLIVGLGWYLTMAFKIPGLLGYFLIDETFKRVASNAHNRNNPFYMFIILLPAGIFPWTSFLFNSLKHAKKTYKQNFAVKLLLFWLLIPLLIFTLSRSKLAAYVLPLLVPLSLLTAISVKKLFTRQAEISSLNFHIKLNAAIIAILGASFCAYGLSEQLASPVLNSSLSFVGFFWLFLAFILCLQVLNFNRKLAFAILCFVAPGFIFFTIPGLRGNEQIKKNKYLPSQWRLLKRISNLPPEQKLINIEKMIEGWYFYTGRNPITWNVNRITRFDKEQAEKIVLSGNKELNKAVDTNSMLVLRSKDIAKISNITGYKLQTLASEGKWLVTVPERKLE